MRYFLGLDGGGTKTHLKMLSETGEIIAESFGGGSNIVSLSERRVAENLNGLISDALNRAGIGKSDCAGLCIGSAGVRQEFVKRRLHEILSGILPDCPVTIVSDAVPVLYGGFQDGAGVAVISGTGSVCLSRGEDGNIHCVGGYGHILGDEGSGYAVALHMIKAVLSEYDGRGERTLLTSLLTEKLGCGVPTGILNFVYAKETGKAEIAALSPLCDEACACGDSAAMKIIADAAHALYTMYRAGAERANLTEEQRKRCLLTGGEGTHSRYLRAAFERELTANVQGARLIKAEYDAATACCMLAQSAVCRNGEK